MSNNYSFTFYCIFINKFFFFSDYKLMADVKLTFNLLHMEGNPSSKLRYPKGTYIVDLF